MQYWRGWEIKGCTCQCSECWKEKHGFSGSMLHLSLSLCTSPFTSLAPPAPSYISTSASFLRPHGQGHKSVPLFSVACPLPLIQSPFCVFSVLAHSVWQLFNKPICFPLTWGRSGGCWRAVRPSWTMKPFPTQHSSSSVQINCGELEINPSYLLFLRKKKESLETQEAEQVQQVKGMAEEITFPGSKGRGEPRSGACEPSLNLAFITSKQKVLQECPLWLILSSKTWKKKHIFLSPLAGSRVFSPRWLDHKSLQPGYDLVWQKQYWFYSQQTRLKFWLHLS